MVQSVASLKQQKFQNLIRSPIKVEKRPQRANLIK
jgi:hypothetical protein